MTNHLSKPDLPSVFIADYEEDAKTPVVLELKVAGVIQAPDGQVMERYLGDLLSDLVSACDFNMKVGETKEAVLETPGTE
jgi:hypothetical protein